ncbi:MAG: hypothetical protein MK052_07600 [Alphaproteobacteria bacterium]|nr:hypothetical protein [Alphaproteobacteria bacterium]
MLCLLAILHPQNYAKAQATAAAPVTLAQTMPANEEFSPPDQDTNDSVSNFMLKSNASAEGDTISTVDRPEDNLYILELVLDKKDVIDEGLLIYVLDDDDLLIPLSAQVKNLQF